MANPSGINQLSPHGYGQKKVQTALKRSAPISGAPMVAGALNAAQENQRRAVRGTQVGSSAAQAGPAQALQPPAPQPTVDAQINQIGRVVAAIPGASPLIKQLVG